MKWIEDELRQANVIHGPDQMHSDTYRLSIPKTDEKKGKELDVPGWMVGDVDKAELVIRAARIIRDRAAEKFYGI